MALTKYKIRQLIYIMNLNYPKKILATQAALIIFTIINTKLIERYCSYQQWMLNWVFMFIFIMLEIGVYSFAFTLTQIQGGTFGLALMRIVTLCIGGFGWLSCFSTLVTYVLYKSIAVIADSNAHIFFRQKDNTNYPLQLKRRHVFLVIFSIAIFLLTSHLVSQTYQSLSVYFFSINLIFIVIQTIYLCKIQYGLVRYLNFSLIFNLFIYIFQSFLFGKYYQKSYLSMLTPLILFLLTYFVIIKMWIGAHQHYSAKNYISGFFNLMYINNADKTSKGFSNLSGMQRIVKILDQFSRILAHVIYYLSFIAFVSQKQYLLFLISIILLNYNELLNQIKPLAFLELKYSIRLQLKPVLSLPLIFLIVTLSTRTAQTQSLQLYEQINHCVSCENIQIFWVSLLGITALASQFVKVEVRRKLFWAIKFLCPCLIFLWICKLECQHINIILMGLYCFGLCLRLALEQTLRPKRLDKKL